MLEHAMLSEVGGRKLNEDAVFAACDGPSGSLFALCDGLGGHGGGEVASALTVQAAKAAFEGPMQAQQTLLQSITQHAQEALLAEQVRRARADACKTTLCLLSVQGGLARYAHVGDSRIYLFEKNKQVERTMDHSVPQMLVLQGEIKEKDIRNHEDRNRLTRVLGGDAQPPKLALSQPITLRAGQRFLLCSDGFWELIVEKEMLRHLKAAGSAAQWLATMADVVRQNGQGSNMDNFSAIAVWI